MVSNTRKQVKIGYSYWKMVKTLGKKRGGLRGFYRRY